MTMQAMQLDAPGSPLRLVERPLPVPGAHQLRLAISACGACRTCLHVVDGDIGGWRYGRGDAYSPSHATRPRSVQVEPDCTGNR